jgi:hypothetical protein
MEQEIKENVEESAESSAQAEVKKSFTQSEVDSMISKAIEKNKATNYQRDLDEGIKKALEDREKKTPEQLKFEQLERELEHERNLRIEKERENLKSQNLDFAKDYLSKNNLPTELAKFIASDDAEKTQSGLESITDVLSGLVTKTKQSVMDGNQVKIPSKTKSSSSDEPSLDVSKDVWKSWLKQNTKLV